jgi:hypothetical protein
MTEDELDKRYDEIVARYPDGLTGVQFRQIALESADDDGRIYPHPIESFARISILLRMAIDGHIENRGGGHNKPFKWYITDKGREFLRG